MDRRDDQALTQLLRQARPTPLDHQTTQRVYDDAWETIRAGLAAEHGTATTTAASRTATRRLAVIAAADAQTRRRRRLARTSAITTAVLLAGAGVAAAGTFVATRTGQHTTGWEVQAGGPGELLDLGGDDRTQVLSSLVADIPFAPGYEHLRDAELTTGNLRDLDPTGEESYAISDSAARGQVARDAICTWADAWVAADASGDLSARDAATTALAGSLQWPAVRELDPDPSPTGYVGDSGVGSATLFGTVPGMIAAAESGQRQQILDAVAVDAWCLDDYIPATLADPAYPGPRFDGPRG